MRKQAGAIFLAVGLTLTAACSGPETSNNPSSIPAAASSTTVTGVQQITVKVGNSMSFAPSSIVVQAGQPVELTLTNEGRIPHDFVLSEGADQPVKVVAAGGQTATGIFTLDQPGSYTFICSVQGHLAAGMKGTITAR